MKVSYPNLDTMPDEPGKLQAGTYRVRCNRYEVTESKKTPGRMGVTLFCSIVDGPNLDDGQPASAYPFEMRQGLWGLVASDPEKTVEALGRNVKSTCRAFGVYIDSEGYDPDEFVGQEAEAEIGPQKDNPQYSEFKRFIAPQ